jgi:beta-1,4-mannosyltransferase
MTRLKKRIYLYPLSSEDKKHGVYNPYMDDLKKSFSPYFEMINDNKPSGTGILDLFRYLHRTDYIFFNWIEKLPDHRFGFFQTILLFFMVPLCRALRIKIVWTMHNKLSHSGKYMRLTRMIFLLMLKRADIILTHSREGIVFGNEMKPGSAGKIVYFAHPVKDRRIENFREKQNDILIWGTISPYKGIDNFLEYLQGNDLQHKYRILIAGRSVSQEYSGRLTAFGNESIRVRDEFISDHDLAELISESRIVLFTYSGESILSSGALMDSLGYGARVVGPHVGAFADLAEEGIIKTFSHFEELKIVLENSLNAGKTGDDNQQLESFLQENSWERFAENVFQILESTGKTA